MLAKPSTRLNEITVQLKKNVLLLYGPANISTNFLLGDNFHSSLTTLHLDISITPMLLMLDTLDGLPNLYLLIISLDIKKDRNMEMLTPSPDFILQRDSTT